MTLDVICEYARQQTLPYFASLGLKWREQMMQEGVTSF